MTKPTKEEILEWFKKNVKYEYYTDSRWENPIEERKKRMYNCHERAKE